MVFLLLLLLFACKYMLDYDDLDIVGIAKTIEGEPIFIFMLNCLNLSITPFGQQ